MKDTKRNISQKLEEETLGSKRQMTKIQKIVVEMKDELEKDKRTTNK